MAISINGSTGISGINGSAATPAIQGGDSDTGIFFGTDTASVATEGNERLIVDANGNINIDSGGVYYDAANNRLGVGTSSPYGTLALQHGNTSPQDLTDIAIDALRINQSVGGSVAIRATQYDSVNQPAAGDIQFFNLFYNGSNYNWYERLRIRSNGDVGIKTSSPLGTLSVGDHNNASGQVNDIYITGDKVNANGYFARLMFRNSNQAGASSASIRAERISSNYATALTFYTNHSSSAGGDGTQRMVIDSNGDTRFDGNVGIDAADVYWTNTYEMDSSWTSYQTVTSSLLGNCVYLVSINWTHGSVANQPYYYTTSFLFSTSNGTNGTSGDNEKTFLHSTHTGNTAYYMTFRGVATVGGGNRLQVKVNSTWPGINSGNALSIALNQIMVGTRLY